MSARIAREAMRNASGIAPSRSPKSHTIAKVAVLVGVLGAVGGVVYWLSNNGKSEAEKKEEKAAKKAKSEERAKHKRNLELQSGSQGGPSTKTEVGKLAKATLVKKQGGALPAHEQAVRDPQNDWQYWCLAPGVTDEDVARFRTDANWKEKVLGTFEVYNDETLTP